MVTHGAAEPGVARLESVEQVGERRGSRDLDHDVGGDPRQPPKMRWELHPHAARGPIAHRVTGARYPIANRATETRYPIAPRATETYSHLANRAIETRYPIAPRATETHSHLANRATGTRYPIAPRARCPIALRHRSPVAHRATVSAHTTLVADTTGAHCTVALHPGAPSHRITIARPCTHGRS